MKKNRILLLLEAVLCCGNVFSQQTDTNKINIDTLNGYFYHTKSYFIDSIYNDSDDVFEVHFYNPLKRTDNDFFHQLNTYGSPSQSLIYNFNSTFLQYQPNIYSPYTYNFENIRFYQRNKPFSELYYSNDLNSSQVFRVTHSQNVYKGLNISLDYLVNYADGTFANSGITSQFFNVTTNYISPKGKYRTEAAFIYNKAITAENGGINDVAFVADSFPSIVAYPVQLLNASTQYKTFDFLLSQSVRLPKALGTLTLANTIANGIRTYRNIESIDTLLAFEQKTLTNTLTYSSTLKFFPVNIGIRHDYNIFADQIMREKSSLVSPFAKISYHVNRIKLQAYAEKTLSSSIFGSNFLLSANASFAFDSLNRNNIFASFASKNSETDFIYRHNFSTSYQWDNSFNTEKTTKLSFGTSLLGRFTFVLNYFIVSDKVYLSENLIPVQKNGLINVYQAIFKNRFTLGRFGFMGSAALQYSDDNPAISLPLFQAKETFYVEFFFFSKKLQTQFGLDLYYNTSFFANAYCPELASFYTQRERKQGNYLYADIFIAVGISRAKLFISCSHPYAGLFGYDYFQTLHYPSEALSFRFGVSWKFFD
ncbi:MAG: putative porin [Bacteroidales bacterium]|jgi:hypothetical protein|nr:putative porin [Bacteroidales bacterium]